MASARALQPTAIRWTLSAFPGELRPVVFMRAVAHLVYSPSDHHRCQSKQRHSVYWGLVDMLVYSTHVTTNLAAYVHCILPLLLCARSFSRAKSS